MKTIISKIAKAAVAAAIAISGLSFANSCTNLDETAYTFIDPNSFYKTEADFDAALNNAYHYFGRIFSDQRGTFFRLNLLTEDFEPNYRKEQPLLDVTNLWEEDINNIARTMANTWSRSYIAINDANIVLGRLEENGGELSQTVKDRMRGQALFLRGYAYYTLVRIYGDCPIPTGYTQTADGLEMEREPAEKVWERVFADLEEAAGLLPPKGTSGYDVWRVSQGACWAALGDAYLYKATVQSGDNERGGNASELQKSLEYSKKVIDSGVYSLYGNYLDNFYYFNKNKNGQESVFDIQFANADGQGWGAGVDCGIGNNTSMTNSKGDILCGTYYNRCGVTNYFFETYDPADTRRGAVLEEFYCKVSGNLRHYVYDHEAELFRVDESFGTFDASKNTNNNYPYWMPEGYAYHNLISAKTIDNDTDMAQVNNTRPGCNYTLIRYADVLLNYAEAANLLKAGDGLAQLNMVHTRAGLPALGAMGQLEMDDAIIQERLWESSGEAKNYFTELRKGVLGDRVEPYIHQYHQDYAKGEKITDSPNSTRRLRFAYEMQFIPKKNFLWKIPKTDLDSNPKLVQTPENQPLRSPKY